MQLPAQPEEFWTHIELAVVILAPIGAGLWTFFNKLVDHSKEDVKSFGAINESMGRMDTKLDAMWEDWKTSDKRRGEDR
jgi:phage-related minor tail protein